MVRSILFQMSTSMKCNVEQLSDMMLSDHYTGKHISLEMLHHNFMQCYSTGVYEKKILLP